MNSLNRSNGMEDTQPMGTTLKTIRALAGAMMAALLWAAPVLAQVASSPATEPAAPAATTAPAAVAPAADKAAPAASMAADLAAPSSVVAASGSAASAPATSAPTVAPASAPSAAPVASAPASAPTVAPTAVPVVAPATLPTSGPAATKPVVPQAKTIFFQFDGTPYNDVVRRFVQQAARKPLIGDLAIEGNLTFFDNEPYTYDEAFDTLNLLLAMRGWVLTDTGRFMEVQPLGQQRPKFLRSGEDATSQKIRSSEFVTTVLPLKFLDADTAAKSVIRNVSRNGWISPLPKGKGIIITDRMESINYIRTVLAALDSPNIAEQQVKTYPLKRASAAAVSDMMNNMFGVNRPRRMVWNPDQKRMVPDNSDPGEFITATSDARTNTVFLVGSTDKLALIDQMIEKLDVEGDADSGDVRIFELKNAKAEELANTIRQLQLAGQPSQGGQPNTGGKGGRTGGGATAGPVRVVADNATNSVIVSASMDQMTTIEKLIQQIDGKAVTRAGAQIFRLESADAQQLAPIITEMGKRRDAMGRTVSTLSVSADSRSNVLVVSGPSGDIQDVAKLIAELDRKEASKDAREIRVVQLKAGDARSLADSLRRLFDQQQASRGPRGGGGASSASGSLRIEADAATNSLIIAAGPADWPTIDGILTKLQASVEPATVAVTRLVPLTNAKASELSDTLRKAYNPMPTRSQRGAPATGSPVVPVVITASDRTNSLLITACQADQQMLGDLIKQLDVPMASASPLSVDPVIIIRLKTADAARLAATLQTMVPKTKDLDISIQPDPTNSVLLLRAPEAQRKMIEDLITKLDSTDGPVRETKLVRLKGASASSLASTLSQLFQSSSAAAPSRTGRGGRGGAAAPDMSGEGIIITAAPDDRTLIIDAPQARIAQVEKLAMSLDMEFPANKTAVRIYQLVNANGNELVPTLSRLFTQQRSRMPGQTNAVANEPQPRFEVDATSNRMLVAATNDQFELIDKLILELDKASSKASGSQVVKLKNGDSQMLATIIANAASRRDAQGRIVQGLSVLSDSRTNSLVVSGMAGDVQNALKLIEAMDVTVAGPADMVQIVKLNAGDAVKVAASLQAMIPPPARGQAQDVFIQPEAATNSVLVRAPESQRKMLLDLISKLDASIEVDRVMEVKKLKGSSATALAATLSQFYQNPAVAQRPGRGAPRPTADASADAVIITAAPDDKTLLIEAPSRKVEQIIKLIDSIDSEFAPMRTEVKIYQLTNANASDIGPTLGRLFTEQVRRMPGQSSAGGNEPQPKFEVDAASNRLLVSATMKSFEIIDKLVKDLDITSVSTGGAKIVKLKNGDAQAFAGIVQNAASRRDAQGKVLAGLSVSADLRTNSLVVAGAAGDVQTAMKLIESMDVASTEGADQIQIVRLEAADAGRLAQTLQAMVPPAGPGKPQEVFIQADLGSNAVLVRAPQSQRKLLEQMIAELDKSSVEPREMRTVKLKGASAAAMASMMNQLYQAGSAVASPAARGPRGAAPSGASGSGDLVVVTAAPDDRTLVIDAPPRRMEQVVKLATDLDMELGTSSVQVRTYGLTNAVAAEMAPSLARLFAEQQAKKTGTAAPANAEPQPKFEADSGTNQLLVAATTRQFEVIEPLITKLNDKGGIISQTRTFRLKFSRASDLAGVLQTMLTDADRTGPRKAAGADVSACRVAAMNDGNVLVVQGLPEKLALAEQLVKALDSEDSSGSSSIQVVPLKNAQAKTLADAVNASLASQALPAGAGGKGGAKGDVVTVTPEPNSNSLLIRGPADRLAPVMDMIRKLDAGGTSNGTAVRTFKLENADAKELAVSIDKFFRDLNASRKGSGEATPFSVASDIRTNSIVVSTSGANFAIVEALLKDLDLAADRPAREMQYYWLTKADASEVASKLNSMFTDRRGVDKPVIEADTYMGAVTVIGKEADLKMIEPIVTKLDMATKDNVRIRVIPMSGVKADRMAEVLKRVYTPMTDSDVVITDNLPSRGGDTTHKADDKSPLFPAVAIPQDTAPGVDALSGGGSTSRPASMPSSQPTSQPGDSDRPRVVIAVDKSTNSLIVSGTKQELENIQTLIDQLASSTHEEAEMRVFKIQNADPQSIATMLSDLFNPKPVMVPGQAAQGRQPRTPAANAKGQPAAPQPTVVAAQPVFAPSGPPVISVAADVRTRTIIVRAKPLDFENIELVVKQLDQAAVVGATEVRVFPLKNTDASELATNLRDLFVMSVSAAPAGATPALPGAAAAGAAARSGQSRRTEAIRTLMEMKSLNGQMTKAEVAGMITLSANRQTNSVVVAAPGDVMALVASFIQELDQSAALGKTPAVRMYTLKQAEVAPTVAALQQLFTAQANRTGGGGPRVVSVDAPVVITGDEHAHLVIVSAPADKHELISKVITEIDQAQGDSPVTVEVYHLQYADSAIVAPALLNTVNEGSAGAATGGGRSQRGSSRTGSSGGAGSLRISADTSSNSLVVRASKEDHEKIAKLIESLDVTAVAQFPVQIIQLQTADATNVAAILNRIFGGAAAASGANRRGATGGGSSRAGQMILIEGDKDSRTLTVRADDETFKKISEVAVKLDPAVPAGAAMPTVIALKFAQAATIAPLLQQAIAGPAGAARAAARGAAGGADEPATIVGEPYSNSLIVTGNAKKLQQVTDLLAKLDVDTAGGAKTEMMILQYAKSTDLANVLSKLGNGALGAGPRPRGAAAGASGQPAVILSADAASNVLILSGPATDVEKMKQLALDMDKASMTGGTETKAIALKNGQASSIAAALTQAFAQQRAGRGAAATPEDAVAVAAEVGSNSLVVTASTINMKKVDALVAMLDAQTEGGLKSDILLLQSAKAVDLAAVLSKVASNTVRSGGGRGGASGQPQVVVSGDAVSNALVINGPAADVEKMLGMARQLDQASTTATGVYIIPLKNGDAVTVAAQVRDLYNQTSKASKQSDTFGVTADERANAIVLATSKDTYEKVQEWIGKVEEMKAPRGNLRIIPLINADPTEVDSAVRQMYSPGGTTPATGRPGGSSGGASGGARRTTPGGGSSSIGGAGGSLGGKVDTTVLAQQRALLVNANDEDYDAIMKLVASLEKSAEAAKRDVRVFTLKNATNTRVAPALDALFRQTARAGVPAEQVTVTAMPMTNAVVVAAAKEKMAEIGHLIEELDKQENSPQLEFRIFPLTNASPTKILPLLKQMIAQIQRTKPEEAITVEADERTKSVIVSARSNVFEQIGKMIEGLDRAPAYNRSDMLVIPLKHADATRLAAVLNEMLRPDPAGQVTPEARALQEQVRLLNVRGGLGDKLPELDLTKPIKIMADSASPQGSNALLIASSDDNLKALRAIVELMDVVPIADGVVLRLVPLKNGDAQSIATILKDIFTQGAALGGKKGTSVAGKAEPDGAIGKALVNQFNISADIRTNTLVMSGSQETVALAEVMIKDLDRNEGKIVTEVRLFKLKNADAVKLMPMLQSVFAETAAAAGTEGLRTQVTRLKTVLDKQAGHQSDLPKTRAALIIQADPSTNTVIVAARNDVMPLIADVIQSMDIAGAGSLNSVRIFPLENADATRAIAIVNSLFTGPNRAFVRAEDIPTIAADTRTNALIVSASDKTFSMIELLLKKLDQKLPIDLRDIRLVPLKNAEADTMAVTLQKMMDARVQRLVSLGIKDADALKVIVMSDPRSNSLVVGGSGEGFDLVKTLAAELDGASPALGGQVQIFPLKNGNASNIAASLTNLFTQRYAAAVTKDVARQKPIILADLRTNALLVAANEDDSKILKSMLEKLDVKLTDPAVQLVVIPMKHNDSGTVGPTLQNIFAARLRAMTPPGQTQDPASVVNVAIEPLSNALIVSASKENIEQINELLKKIDVEPPTDTGVIKIYALQFADVSTVASLLQGLVAQGLYKPAMVGAANNPTLAAREKVSITSDIRTNSLIISASKENLTVLEQIIKKLDTDVSLLTGDIRVYTLNRADATKMAPMLQQFFTQKRAGELSVNPQLKLLPVVVIADGRTNTILVAGGKENFAAVDEMVKQLDGADIPPLTDYHVFYLKNATAAALQPTLSQMLSQRVVRGGATKDPITVLADPKTNSLIVGATADDMKLAESLVAKLDAEGKNGLAVQVFPLRKADATATANTIKTMMATQGGVVGQGNAAAALAFSISVDERTNSLIVSAGQADLDRIRELVNQLDKETATRVTAIRVFPLVNADAKELSTILMDVLTSKPKSAIPENPNRQPLLQFITKSDQGKDLIANALQEGVLITPDTRTNSLVVSAPLENMPLLESLVKAMDATSPRTAEIRVFALQNADARQMADVLTQLFKLQSNANGANPNGKAISYTLVTTQPADGAKVDGPMATLGNAEQSALSVTVDVRTNSLLVGGTKQYVELASKIITDLDASPAQERLTEVYHLRNARAGDVQTALRSFLDQERARLTAALGTDKLGAAQRLLEQEVAVVSVPSEGKPENSNTLLVSASPRYFTAIEKMIEELDQPPPQVLIQVLLAEVTLDDSLELGMDAMFTKKFDDTTVRAGTSFGTAAEIVKNNGFSVSVTGGDVNFFLRALQTQGRLEVLDRPQILASDNQLATINVGQSVPFITDSQITETGNQLNTIQYKPVGVILTVTPRTNPDGLVKMNVSTEVSSLSTSSVQISAGVNATIINQRNAQTIVTVQDGHTSVIGGLITTHDENHEDKVPLLGDIPLLGNLFKKTTKTKQRTELLIILTPHVMRNTAALDAQTKKQVERYNSQVERYKNLMKHDTNADEIQRQLVLPAESQKSGTGTGRLVISRSAAASRPTIRREETFGTD